MKLNERGETKTRTFADPNKPVEGNKATKLMSKTARRTTKAKYAAKKTDKEK